jgi:ribonucleoside-diphosphate reductase beta chain
MSYLFFAAIFEGTWFYNGFTPIFAMQRRGLMRGTGEQFQYIMRDEVMHASFGLRVIRTMLDEEGLTLDPSEVADMWSECYYAELDYIQYVLKSPILGYSVEMHMNQFKYIANRRMRQIGLPEPYPGADDAIPWLDEQINTRKEKNFFETRVTEYQTGGSLNFDD